MRTNRSEITRAAGGRRGLVLLGTALVVATVTLAFAGSDLMLGLGMVTAGVVGILWLLHLDRLLGDDPSPWLDPRWRTLPDDVDEE